MNYYDFFFCLFIIWYIRNKVLYLSRSSYFVSNQCVLVQRLVNHKLIIVVIKAYSQAPPANGLLYLPLPGKVHKLFHVFVLYVNTFPIYYNKSIFSKKGITFLSKIKINISRSFYYAILILAFFGKYKCGNHLKHKYDSKIRLSNNS